MPQPKRPRRDKRRPSPPLVFLVNPIYNSRAASDSKLGTAARRMFDVVPQAESRKLLKKKVDRAMLFHYAYFKVSERKTMFASTISPYSKASGTVPLSRIISPALALYRTMVLFPGAAVMTDGEDCMPVSILLKHTTTGQTLILTEFKGGFRFLADFREPKDAPKAFLRDIARLMDILTSQQCPHPYEGLVAGNVA